MTLIKATSHIKRGTHKVGFFASVMNDVYHRLYMLQEQQHLLFSCHYVFFVLQHNKTDPGSVAFAERGALERVTITTSLDKC